MRCSKCNSEKSALKGMSRRTERGVMRFRECCDCGEVWPTFETVAPCDKCGSDKTRVDHTYHYGADRKIRMRVCRECGNRLPTFEIKMGTEKERLTA